MSKHTPGAKALKEMEDVCYGYIINASAYRRIKDVLTVYDVLLAALEGALAHELHTDGKCGCCWTEKARDAIDKARRIA